VYLQHYRTRSLPDGGWRWLEARGRMSDQGEGGPGRLRGILIDVTERKQLEAERERARTQVTEVLESMGDAFFALDRDWRFALVNAKYEQLSRRSREQILGHLFWEGFPDGENPASWYFQSYHRCMTERVPVSFVDDYPALDLWLDVRVYPTDDGGIAAFFRDVSSERRAAFLRQRQAEFEQHLVGIVSHDLRTPLNAITLGAGALLGSEQLDGTSLRIASRIRASAERAGRMIRDLLDFTQARLGGGIPVRPGPLDLYALVQQVVEEVEASTPGREIELRQQGDGQVDGDSDRLAQVVGNLLTNALKYSPDGSPVRVRTVADGTWLWLSIHNEGAPIVESKLTSIFEPMQRATADIDRRGRSVGLGLYIVKHIVEAHQGTVEVSSRPGEGTTFT
ncbi:MAG: PAS domain-containing sensor histidine kinase, partial [Myxococcales bacterium]